MEIMPKERGVAAAAVDSPVTVEGGVGGSSVFLGGSLGGGGGSRIQMRVAAAVLSVDTVKSNFVTSYHEGSSDLYARKCPGVHRPCDLIACI